MDLSPEDFALHSHRLSDWIATYLRDVGEYDVLPSVTPGAIRARLPQSPPAAAESLDAILADLDRVVLPGATHWNHPGFLAYFANTASVPGILGEMVTAALNLNGMLWRTSPVATELEQVVTDWLRQLFGMGDGWFGMITDTASISTMYALAAARERDPALAIRQRGMAGRGDLPRLRVYCSEHAHSSVDKAAMTLGLGLENVVHVASDGDFRLRPDMLTRAIQADRAQGFRPIAVVATAGTTSMTSVDPIDDIATICQRESLWLHVDGAYGGSALSVPELRPLFKGLDRADSVVVNPHKWLFTPMDCSVLFTRQPKVLRRAFSLVPEYLTTSEGDEALNYMDYGLQLGRRFRALKLWMVVRAFGADGIADRIRYHCQLAQRFAEHVRAAGDGWSVCAPVPFSTVCFRHVPAGETDETEIAAHNAAIMARVNESGDIFISHTKLGDQYVLRVAIGNLRTTEATIDRAWELIRDANC
ncbi:MAG: amino acid decarboxylase [Gemmatimonadaceae bacterium]|nr:amino acid decarboxylase [Gemmatimonadaceae bacterium]